MFDLFGVFVTHTGLARGATCESVRLCAVFWRKQ